MEDRPQRIVLVGMMGSGKTSVGRRVGEQLGWPMLDNDALVRASTGKDGPTIFRESGEDALHAAERTAFVEGVNRDPPAVLTVAASVVDDPALRRTLRDAGWVVWLRAEPRTLRDRIDRGAGRRADAVDETWLATLAADRAALYESVADQVVDVDQRSIDEIAATILDRTGLRPAASTG